MYLTRTLENYLMLANDKFPVLLVTGPRQVGKTTLLQHLLGAERQYVSLDDPTLRLLAKDEPKLFLQRFKPPVLIDEIQYAPELLPYIKIHVDQNKQAGAFWLTGSQPFHLMQGISESLAGRVGIVNLLGLSQQELNHNAAIATPFIPSIDATTALQQNFKPQSMPDIYHKIWLGSYPALSLAEQADRDLFYSSYVQTYLQRDIRDLAQVGDNTTFMRFLKATAARTGQLLNLTDLARDVDVSPNTAKRWLSILEASHIIYLLKPFFSNLSKRIIKSPKLYFFDTGLCSYLTDWSSSETLAAGAMSGSILETFVISEIIKSYWHNGKQEPIYYYRDKDKVEIDLLIFQDDIIYPVEIKKTASPDKKHVKNFASLEKLGKEIGPGGIICLTDSVIPITETINAFPVAML